MVDVEKSVGAKKRGLFLGAGIAAIVLVAGWVSASESARFVAGGALINAGYRLQDHVEEFEVLRHHDVKPEEIWREVVEQNLLASGVRKRFPRSTHHPLVAMVVCMDARVDTVELTGDTRKFYYVVRTAGSVLGPQELDMLELAVANGVKVVVLTTHTDCAAEKVAADPMRRPKFPALSAGIDEREARITEFLARPLIASKIAAGELVVKRMQIDTANEDIRSP
jgi:hypothetical protein